MNAKKRLLTVIFTIIVLLPGCSSWVDSGDDDGLVRFVTHWENEGKYKLSIPGIIFPCTEIDNDENSYRIADKINDKMQEAAYSMVPDNRDSSEVLSLVIENTVEFINDRIISVCYMGYKHFESDSQPTGFFFTRNIDIKTGKDVDIKGILSVNLQLIDTIKKEAEFININKQSEKDVKKLRKLLKQYDSKKLLSEMKNQDANDNEISIYFTQEALGISLPVKHNLGDYANYEVDYQQLSIFLVEDLYQPPVKMKLHFSDAMTNSDKDITNKIFKEDIEEAKVPPPDNAPDEFALYSSHADISSGDNDIVFMMINSRRGGGGGEFDYNALAVMYVCSKNNKKWEKIEVAIPSDSILILPRFFNDSEKDRIFVLESSTDGYHDLKWYIYELARYAVFKYDKQKKIYYFQVPQAQQ